MTAALLVTALALCGCEPALRRATPFAQATATLPDQEYKLVAGDTIEVRHLLNREYNDVVVIRNDGRITLPGLDHSVRAAGLTTDELTADLKSDYVYTLRDVQISVSVRGFSSQRVYVGGEVARPGIVEMPGPQNLLQALFVVGGWKPTARLDEIVVLRNGTVFAVDLKRALNGLDLAQNIALRPLDTVYVPESDIGRVNRVVDLYVRQLLPFSTSVGASYNINPVAEVR